MVRFLEIEAEGFGSLYERQTFKLDRGNSLNVIRGKVGAGKTTIPSIIFYALYGKTLKEKATVETWPELRDDNFRGTYTKITYDIAGSIYTVIRCKSFKSKITVGKNKKVKGGSGLYYLIDGELITTGKGKINIQNLIEKDLGYSMDLFKNSIIFGQKMKRIIEETGPMKKKVFEEAFEVSFIDDAKKITEKEKEKLVQTQREIKDNIEKLEDKLDNKQELYDAAIDREKTFEKDRDKRIKELREDIKELREEQIAANEKIKSLVLGEPESLQLSITSLGIVISKAVKHNKKCWELDNEIKECQKTIEKIKQKLKSKDIKKCPECGTTLEKEHQKKRELEYQQKLKDEKEYLKTCLKRKSEHGEEIDITKKQKELDKLRDNYMTLKEADREYYRLEELRETLVKKIKTLEGRIKQQKEFTLEIKSSLYIKAINRLTRNIKKQQRVKSKIDNQIAIQNWLITDPLSNNGLKAYMFDNLLQDVNYRLDEYSKILGFQIEFGIDLDSHRKDFYQAILKDGIIIPYEDLSGGQKQLVDTSVAFAIHDVISEIRPTNLLFLDEPFESLDLDNIEIVAELVQEKAKNKSLFLITHHQGFSPINANYLTVTQNDKGHTILS